MNDKVARCLLVSKVLVADGMMTSDERRFFDELMSRLAVSDDDRRRMIELEGWDDAEALLRARLLDDRRALLEELVDTASADGRLSRLELATIRRVAAGLGVTH
ncbi:MAG TPA: TerB family tellurite resistance protein [Kofleriaceae bacterium]|nr:TerB family tellurite resistance protein [Kofleriaceae bacterium]